MTNDNSAFTVRDNPAQHRFEIELGGGDLAIAEYRLEGETITFTHTAVPPAHEGHGVGKALVKFALDTARQRRLQVVPVCSFFAAYMKRHAEVQDMLTPESRKALGLG